jgi:YbbR domain-containing protein
MIAFLRHLIFDDFLLKVFSVALALLIWLTVSFAIRKQGSPTPPLTVLYKHTFVRLPVVVMSSAADVRSFSVKPKEVEVTVEGEARLLKDLRAEDIRVRVDLTGVEAPHDLRKRIEVSTPVGVAPVRVEPEEVQVIYPSRN